MVDLRSLHLEPGDHRREAIEVLLEPVTLGGLTYRAEPSSPAAELEITRLRSGILFGLRFATTVHGACHRCLEDAAIELTIDAEEYQADDPASADDEVCEYYHPLEGELDTDLWASNAVVLSLPTRILCRVDCRGLCSICGANLNETTCDCTHESVDTRWSALAELRLRDE